MFWNLIVVNYEKYHLHHLLLFILLALYSICGALLFCGLESTSEDIRNAEEVKRLVRQSVAAKKELVKRIRWMYFERSNATNFNETEFRTVIEKYDIDMSMKPTTYRKKRWDLWGALYYAGTLYTTIGYGDMAAMTTWGRIFTMIYAMIGIPLVITILNDWGTIMFYVVDGNRELTSEFAKQCREARKEDLKERRTAVVVEAAEAGKSIRKARLSLPNYKIKMNALRRPDATITATISVLGFWTVLCSAMFVFFEKWTFFESLYFFFISLTTIGLGDLTLSHNVAVANFLPILIGLSVCSMAINVTQMQLEILFGKIVKLIDTDFKTNLSESDDEKKKLDDTAKDGDMQPRLSKMRQRKEKDVINQYCTIMTSSDRFLMRFLSDHHVQNKSFGEKELE
ncbi:hypothetical protein Angca_002490 [Angiostrongylus cantonensis]|nr:hypothetical protein Angca_002490 [Angiostrongylus cantonensis]